MPLVKKVQKMGNASAILLHAETTRLLGIEPGMEIVLEVIGDTLLVRRLGAEPPSEWQVLAGLQSLRDAALVPKGGEMLIEKTQRTLLVLRAFGPMTAAELAERVGYSARHARNKLAALVSEGYATESGGEYSLNVEAFR